MPTTDREGMPNSGEVTVTDADDDTPQTVVDTRADTLFEINQLVIEYDPAGAATIELTLHDDADGTAAGNLSAARKTILNLSPGDVRSYDDLSMRDFEEDVLIQGDTQDADVHVYADGKDITEPLG